MGTIFLRCVATGGSVFALMAGLASEVAAHHISASDAQVEQGLPIDLGTTGSSREHLVIKNRLFCYTGTLGALVTKNGVDYILSNNHVLAKENENLDQGTGFDDQIIQPGILDVGTCSISSGENEDESNEDESTL